MKFRTVFWSFVMVASVSGLSASFADADRDAKRTAKDIRDLKLDRDCGLNVDFQKVEIDGKKDFNMVIDGFAGQDRAIIDKCDHRDGKTYCYSIKELDLDGRSKVCQLDRVVYTPSDDMEPAIAFYSRSVERLGDGKNCTERRLNRKMQRSEIKWHCTAVEKI